MPKTSAEPTGAPLVFNIIRKCQKYGIDYEIMKRLNYRDLLALLVEYDIETLKEHLAALAAQKRQGSGPVREATNEDILKMHRRR